MALFEIHCPPTQDVGLCFPHSWLEGLWPREGCSSQQIKSASQSAGGAEMKQQSGSQAGKRNTASAPLSLLDHHIRFQLLETTLFSSTESCSGCWAPAYRKVTVGQHRCEQGLKKICSWVVFFPCSMGEALQLGCLCSTGLLTANHVPHLTAGGKCKEGDVRSKRLLLLQL